MPVPVIASCPAPLGIPRSMNGCDMLSLDNARHEGKASNGRPSVSNVYRKFNIYNVIKYHNNNNYIKPVVDTTCAVADVKY